MKYVTTLSLFISTLISTLLITACFQKSPSPDSITATDEVDTSERVYKYLALGDSYTIGQGVEVSQRWPLQLFDSLGLSQDSITIIARTGWTTRNLLDASVDLEPNSYDLVSLLIGVNNQYQGRDFEIFKNEFDSLLDRSIQLSGESAQVFVVSIPDYGYSPFGANNQESISQEIDQYNQYMQAQAQAKSVLYYNITDISRGPQGTLADDRLHPDGAQYAHWVSLMKPGIQTLLNRLTLE